jgi:hypothetical protein
MNRAYQTPFPVDPRTLRTFAEALNDLPVENLDCCGAALA